MDDNLYIFIKGAFMVICVGVVIFLVGLSIPDSIVTTKPNFLTYTGFLINIFEEIKKTKEKSVNVGECFICLKGLVKEIKTNKEENEDLLVFNCKHCFHKLCQETLTEYRCVICNEIEDILPTAMKEHNLNQITENQVQKLVRNLSLMYSPKEIEEYYEFNIENSEIFNKIFKVEKKDLIFEESVEEIIEQENENSNPEREINGKKNN